MMPEETAQAGLDLGAKNMIPVHWGTFTLSVHKWNEPVERFIEQANKNNQQYTVPELAETLPALKILRISQARVLSFVNQDPDYFEKHSVCLDFSTF